MFYENYFPLFVDLSLIDCGQQMVSCSTHSAGGRGIILASAANRLIGEVVQSRRSPLLGPSPG